MWMSHASRAMQLPTPSSQQTTKDSTLSRMAFRYRKFKVYQDALLLHSRAAHLAERFPREYWRLADQLRRAALSVPLNIAEGSAKESDKDFNRFVAISLGSVNETAACCEVALGAKLISDSEFSGMEALALEVTNQLGGLSKKLRAKL